MFLPPSAQRLAACSSKVDFPIPGSPPSRMAEPSTRPPPSTRSSSPMVVDKRAGEETWVLSEASSSPRLLPGFNPLGVVVTASSTSVFHSPQASHLPAHLGEVAPQDWQA